MRRTGSAGTPGPGLLESVEELAPVHAKQRLTCLRASGLKWGLLVNFGAVLFKRGVKRVVNGLAG